VPADVPITVPGEDGAIFVIRARNGSPDGGFLLLRADRFINATWVNGHHADELGIRTDGVDLALMRIAE
jgi:hypothetical protein